MHSIHFFMFPFQWDYFADGKASLDQSFKSRTDLQDIEALFKEEREALNWSPTEFKIQLNQEDDFHTFNEFNYFHNYARNVLAISQEQENSVLQYKYQLANQAAFFEFSTIDYTKKRKEGDQNSEYSLKINEILINFYETGVGNLVFHLENHDFPKPIDVLRINDFGRRIYPQFLGTNAPYSDAPKSSFLPDEVRLTGVLPNGQEVYENFDYYDDLARMNGEPIRLPKHIQKLLTNSFGISHSGVAGFGKYIVLKPVIDDRMFTMCYYKNSELVEQLKQKDAHLEHPFWYAYLFVDSNDKELTIKYLPLQKELLKSKTYLRWIGNEDENNQATGHLFGATRYSFMILAADVPFSQYLLNNHFRYIYFQMVGLALMQRASILRFSAEAANTMALLKGSQRNTQKLSSIKELYLEYIYFINKILFREITPQEQGIELYDMIRQQMEIDTDAKALEKELEDLHKYGLLLENEEGNKRSGYLNWVATIFASFSLVAAFFGFSNFPANFSLFKTFGLWIISSLILLGLLLLILKLITVYNKKS